MTIGRVTIHPLDGVHPTVGPLDCSGPPVWNESAKGGFGPASIPCNLKARDLEYIQGGRVVLEGPRGPVYSGIVLSKPVAAGGNVLTCAGPAVLLEMVRPHRWYVHNKTGEWQEGTFDGRTPEIIQFGVAGSRLMFTSSGSVTLSNNDSQRAYLRIPKTDGCRIEFGWTRDNTDWQLDVFWGDWSPNADGHESDSTWAGSSVGEVPYGSGSTSGTVSIDITDTCDLILLKWVYKGSGGSGQTATIGGSTALKVYGVDGVTSATVSNILDHLLDDLPTSFLPSGAAYRDIAGVTDTMASLALGPEETSTRYLKELFREAESDLLWDMAIVDNEWWAKPTIRAWDTDPSYSVRLWESGVTPQIKTPSLLELCDEVRVVYDGADGHPEHTDVPDPDSTNYLSAIGLPNMHVIRPHNANSSNATAGGQRYHGTRKLARGSIVVKKPVAGSVGEDVHPYEIRAARLIKCHRRAAEPQIGRLDHVRHDGFHNATLTLGDGNDRIEAVLAKAMRRS